MINKKFTFTLKNKIIQKPFDHIIFDNFLDKNFLNKVLKEFPEFNDKIWHEYSNFCENKKSCNQWNSFKPSIYKLFFFLNSNKFNDLLGKIFRSKIYSDPGLHGAGINIMKNNVGKLNPHLDNSLHPKNGLKRKFNLILFVSKAWNEKWGGHLTFYKKNKNNKNMYGDVVTKIKPKFNRVVIFNTSQNSWHSVEEIKGGKSVYRRTIATYYFVKPSKKNPKRYKALYAPTKEQLKNSKVIKFIKKRSDIKKFKNFYKI